MKASLLVSLVLVVLTGLGGGCRRVDTPVSSADKPPAQPDTRPVVPSPPKSADKFDIFARIWDLPESHVSVTRAKEDGLPAHPSAVVCVHEQGRAGNCLDEDYADRPLLTVLDETVFERPTFKTAMALFDNYSAAELRPEISVEDTENQHWKEVDDFLDAVFASKPMQLAVDHVQNVLAPGLSKEEIRADVKSMWFEPFTNQYGRAQPYCVGFEHVFIGEDESNAEGAPKCQDRVGGYHCWFKFYRDQQAGKADYLGYDYPDGNVPDALSDPKVTTMVMKWSPSTDDGAYGHDLLKKPGGFFVGTCPEVEIVFGMLAMYAQKAGVYDNVTGKENHHRVKLGNNYIDLVMHPQSLAPPQQGRPARRGDHIRTLYPKFRGSTDPDSPGQDLENGLPGDLPTQPHNDAPIRIIRALPNPATPDDEGEWVELVNMTEDTTFDLAAWRLTDRLGREQRMTGELAPGAVKRIILDRADHNSMMLKNGKGWILLFQGEIRRAAVQYLKSPSDQIVEF